MDLFLVMAIIWRSDDQTRQKKAFLCSPGNAIAFFYSFFFFKLSKRFKLFKVALCNSSSFLIKFSFNQQEVLHWHRFSFVFLSQRPYMAVGTLREQMIYPDVHADQIEREINDVELVDILEKVVYLLFLLKEFMYLKILKVFICCIPFLSDMNNIF